MTRRAIDLSQPLSNDTQVAAPLPAVQILRQLTHADVRPGKLSIDAEVIITSNHAGTHVDALRHFDADPDAPRIAEMPLETFFGSAVCVDVREYPAGHEVTVAELERAVEKSGHEIRTDDILLFCTDHYNRTGGTQAFFDGFSGIAAACVHWMAERGVKIFGVETLSPDLIYMPDVTMANHRACAERGITHYENLNNLKEVIDRRFEFYGFPLRLDPAAGSPVRAVAIVDE
jgi:kynurenine formamidase